MQLKRVWPLCAHTRILFQRLLLSLFVIYDNKISFQIHVFEQIHLRDLGVKEEEKQIKFYNIL